MIIALKNAGDAGRDSLMIPYSKMKESIAKVLKAEGFIKSFEIVTKKDRRFLSVSLILDKRTPKIRGVKRVSKTLKRVYKKVSDIRPVKQGYGVLILTTPEGVMSGKEARKAGVGGEVLFSIW